MLWVKNMKFNPVIHQRRSLRLQNYDYSQPGAYFVTICSQKRVCRFGAIASQRVILNESGHIVSKYWHHLPVHFSQVELDAAVIMPNHFHGILVMNDRPGNRVKLGQIIAYFKYKTTQDINKITHTPGLKIWQRNYYEHIIRNEDSLQVLREYITNNPLSWELDQLHPDNPSRW